MNKHKAFIGIISYLGPEVTKRADRIMMHHNQLIDIMYTYQLMFSEYKEDPIPIIRVEQEWDSEVAKEVAVDGLSIESIPSPRITPGAARNILLKRLYDSDNDWLICIDDDHWLYPKFEGYKILWELSKGNFEETARNQMAFSAFPAYWFGFQKYVDKWNRLDTHWLFIKTKHPGAMPFCCIPNLKKFKGVELYFNEETDCTSVGAAPEDLQFFIDWLALGGKWFESACMIAKSEGDLNNSSLFVTPEDRRERDLWVKETWRPAYLKQKFPRQPALWSFRELGLRKNPAINWEVEKYWK